MNKLSKGFFLIIILLYSSLTNLRAQTADRWQQRVEYKMEIDMDVKSNQFTGKQSITYYNNSPDTLKQVFYHLYFNAFQPGSMMDVRSRTIQDPDGRVRDRIFYLKENEIGYHKIKSLKQDGQNLSYEVVGTILEVELAKPILPGQKTKFDMEFESQVPKQVRRSGRDNAEGIRFSMTQWYPKLCEYDYQGWHANPYVAREFHGVWGDFDVKISIDPSYIVASSGYLQNPQEIGYGYEKPGTQVKRPKGKKLTWHFKAPQVHDFAWAADPDYTHDILQVPDGPELHFFYKKGAKYEKTWKEGAPLIVKAFQFMNNNFGKYPYKVFSTIQGGDGGMEYPMATLITGDRPLTSFVGVTVHELIHSWFQGVLATNESLYAWVDEGFTTYASSLTMQYIFEQKGNPLARTYVGYISLSKSGVEEPMTTHADHFSSNYAYGAAAYTKGSVFLAQLAYIVGPEVFGSAMKEYFETWKFRHPIPNDLMRIMEKRSGLQLDWYQEYFVNTTKSIDYGVKEVKEVDGKTEVLLEKVGEMPMPLEVVVTYKDGKEELYYIPLRMMRGEKKMPADSPKTIIMEDWPWTNPEYTFTIDASADQIEKIVIDPNQGMADVDRKNNKKEMGN